MGGPWWGRGPGAGAEGGRGTAVRGLSVAAAVRPRPRVVRGRLAAGVVLAAPATTVRRRVGFVAAGVERAVELVGADRGVVERAPAAPVGEGEAGRLADVEVGHAVAPPPCGVGDGGAAGHQVAAHPVDAEGGAGGRDPEQLRLGQRHLRHPGPGGGDAGAELASGGRVRLGAGRRGAVVAEPGPHHLGPPGRVVAGQDGDAQAEAVQQLGPQLALLGVHGADQQEP